MENASQALLIAGGVLIAIVLITLGVYVYVSLHNVASMQDQKAQTEQLVNFNKKYEAYNKSLMHGTDVATVCFMAAEDNRKYGYNITIEYKINNTGVWILNTENKRSVRTSGNMLMGDNEDLKDMKDQDKEKFDDFKRRLFRCESDRIKYDDAGRIEFMSFVEVDLNDYEHK